jgi:hypothetical protein
MKNPRFLSVLVLLFLILPIPLCFGTTITIHVVNFDFTDGAGSHIDPTIELGDTVQWVWDANFHSTTSVAGQSEVWDSGIHSTPFDFSHTFTHLGTFVYFCQIHGFDNGDGTAGGMSGSINVVPVSTPEGGPGLAGLLTWGGFAFAYGRMRIRETRRSSG